MPNVEWVAELGSMHKGNPHLAYEMIRQFAQAGATTIKFQFGWNKEAQERWGLDYNPIRYIDEHAEFLFEACNQFDVQMLASIWSDEGLNTARRVGLQYYKLAAKAALDKDFSRLIYRDGIPTFVSLDRHSPVAEFHQNFRHSIQIWCRSLYPTYPVDLIEKDGYPGMPDAFTGKGNPNWYGYSDHAHGTAACLLAVARGAQYIEKHCCLDKTDLATKDTTFSATPQEFGEMVRIGDEIANLVEEGV